MSKLQWRIYYADGQTIDNLQKSPFYVQRHGVVCVVIVDKEPDGNHNVGRMVLHGWDNYCWNNQLEMWFGATDRGADAYELLHMGPTVTLRGQTILTSLYNRILTEATEDPDFPRKSATKVGEAPWHT